MLTDIHHILPAFFILAALDVGMRQFVDDHHLRMNVQDGIQVHFLDLLSLVERLTARNQGQTAYQCLRPDPSMRLDVADPDVYPATEQLVRLRQHPVRLAYTGNHADVDFEVAAP